MILVSGASGTLGSRLVPTLAGRGHEVRVLTRDAARVQHLVGPNVRVVLGDLRDPSTVRAAVSGATVVVAAAHGFAGPGGVSPASVDRDGNAALVDAATAAGADVVLLSVVGAAEDHVMELFRMKAAAESHLRASGTRWSIVAATAYVETWVGLMRQTAARSGRPLVFGRGRNPINFVSADDVAAVVAAVVDDPAQRGRTVEVGGPENLTMVELAAAVQAADGRTGPARHVPPPALRVMAETVGRVRPQLRRMALAALAMDSSDLSFHRPAAGRVPPVPARTTVRDVLAHPSVTRSRA